MLAGDGTLVVASHSNFPDVDHSYGIDPTGRLVWTGSGPGQINGSPARGCDGRMFADSNGWRAFDPMGGALWVVPNDLHPTNSSSSPLVTASGEVFVIDVGGNGYAISSDGMVRWKKALPGGASILHASEIRGVSVAKIGRTLFTVLRDGNLHAIDADSGTEKWARPVHSPLAAVAYPAPVIDGHRRLYYSSGDGYLYAFDTDGNQLWRLATSGVPCAEGEESMAQIAIGPKGTIYLVANDGYLYAFE